MSELNPTSWSVECESHGRQPKAFACVHILESLRTATAVGFYWTREGHSARPDAWCTACNERLEKAGCEWAEEVVELASFRVLCGACYDLARQLNLG